jgi:hypothetical protein
MTADAHLDLSLVSKDGARQASVVIGNLIVAGWTGRNVEAMEAHIRELEELGIARPKTTPIYYRVAAAMLTTDVEIQVSGTASSGEVEAVFYRLEGELWVGVGSDHTDRQAETINVSLSKQMCHKPVSATLWRFADVVDHWDQLQLRSWAHIDGERQAYQEGPVTTMRDPAELMEKYGGLADNAAMFCGTLAVEGGIRPADAFEFELEDPVLGRTIRHQYAVTPLPVEG